MIPKILEGKRGIGKEIGENLTHYLLPIIPCPMLHAQFPTNN